MQNLTQFSKGAPDTAHYITRTASTTTFLPLRIGFFHLQASTITAIAVLQDRTLFPYQDNAIKEYQKCVEVCFGIFIGHMLIRNEVPNNCGINNWAKERLEMEEKAMQSKDNLGKN